MLDLVRSSGAVPDFVAPLTDDFDAGLDQIRVTPRSIVCSDERAKGVRRILESGL